MDEGTKITRGSLKANNNTLLLLKTKRSMLNSGVSTKNISTLLQLRLAFLENERPYLRLWVGVDNWDVSLERWLTVPSIEKICTVLIDILGYS